MRLLLALGIAGLAVAGCAGTDIAHLDSDAVVVEAGLYSKEQTVWDTASEGCGEFGKVAQPLRLECLNDSCTRKHHHFACI